MEAVSRGQLRNLLPLYCHDFPNRTACLSFIHGETSGDAFVDTLSNPTACIIVLGFGSWTFVGGKPNQDWINHTLNQLCRDRELYLVWATWSANTVEPPPKGNTIRERFEFKDLSPLCNQSVPTVEIPQGCHFLKMDVDLLKRCLWRDVAIMAHGNVDNFLRYLGFCLMSGDEIYCELRGLAGGGPI